MAKIIKRLGFKAADPKMFEQYIKNYGPEVKLSLDHSQTVQLESVRLGIGGTKRFWPRVLS